MPKKTLPVAALFLFALLSALPLCFASDPAAVTASPASLEQPAAGGLDAAPDPGFATWLASQETGLAALPETAARCRPCAECPASQPFCCPTSAGCARCFDRAVSCQEL